jgi:hypothetical protein
MLPALFFTNDSISLPLCRFIEFLQRLRVGRQ